MKNEWFSVDKEGLAKILERRGGKLFAVYELIQNAWDEDTTLAAVDLSEPRYNKAILRVEDDSPEGFKDLAHAFTLFAESAKKSDPSKRGRFNLGEKLVLAVCDWAEIVTTKGTVRFDETGRRKVNSRHCTEKGSIVNVQIRITKAEYDAVCQGINHLIPPTGIRTTFNGREIPGRKPIATFETFAAHGSCRRWGPARQNGAQDLRGRL